MGSELKLGAETSDDASRKKRNQTDADAEAPCQQRYQLRSRGVRIRLSSDQSDRVAEPEDSLEEDCPTQTTISDLPYLAMCSIFDNLTIAESLQLSRVSKAWRRFALASVQSASTLNIEEMSTTLKDNKRELLKENVVSVIRQMSANQSTKLKTIDLADVFRLIDISSNFSTYTLCKESRLTMWNLIGRTCPGLEVLKVHEAELSGPCAKRILSSCERLRVFQIDDCPFTHIRSKRVLESVVIEQARCPLQSLTAPLNCEAVKLLPLKFPHLQHLNLNIRLRKPGYESEWNVQPLKQLGLKELVIRAYFDPAAWFDQLFDENIFESPLSRNIEVLHVACDAVSDLTYCFDALERLAGACPKLRDVSLDPCETLDSDLLRLFSSLEVLQLNVNYVEVGTFDFSFPNLKSLKLCIEGYLSRTDIVSILANCPVLTSFAVSGNQFLFGRSDAFKIDDWFFQKWAEIGRECHRPWDAPLTWTLMCPGRIQPELCEQQVRKTSSLGLNWGFSHLYSLDIPRKWSCPCAGLGKGKAFYLPINATADDDIFLI